MEDQLEQLLFRAVQSLQQHKVIPPEVPLSISVMRNRDARHGDYATNLALTLAKSVGMEPIELAKSIIQSLPDSDRLRAVEVAEPGFINFFLADSERQDVVPRILATGEQYGSTAASQGIRVQLVVVTAGLRALLDIDQGRCVTIAATQANLLTAAGCDVQIGHLAIDAGDPGDCQWQIEQDLGAGPDSGLGQVVNFASDIAFFQSRMAQGFDQVLYLFGSHQQELIDRTVSACTTLGYAPDRLAFMLIESTHLLTRGEPAKQDFAADAVVTFEQLLDEVGRDVARYFCVMRKHSLALEFDLELAKSQIRDNPVYNVQYAHARICSILRTARDQRVKYDEEEGLANLTALTEPCETELMTLLGSYPETLVQATTAREPHQITSYLQELANGLNKYYEAQKWLVENPPLRNARLCLILAARQVLSNGLRLIDVSAPEVL